MNTKKRAIVMREGLTINEKEVEDLQDVDHVEEILRVGMILRMEIYFKM